jgi:hypothetical protein
LTFQDQIIPGNAVAVDKTYPFTQLNTFGSNFLNRFEASKVCGNNNT